MGVAKSCNLQCMDSLSLFLPNIMQDLHHLTLLAKNVRHYGVVRFTVLPRYVDPVGFFPGPDQTYKKKTRYRSDRQ